MPLREFVDRDGKHWQVWQIQPSTFTPSHGGPERRKTRTEGYTPERRSTMVARRLLTPELDGGWLCFMSDQEKRRLNPVPEDWERCPDESLAEYCERARSVTSVLPQGEPLPLPDQT